MTSIKDSVHGYVDLCSAAETLLDTVPVQRLRYVRQLSTVQLVYPSANHTRFEHSLGVYHLAATAAERLDVDAGLARRLRIAALVHDVGHGPFGHQTEHAIERHLGRHHDEIAVLLDETELGPVLDDLGVEPTAVAESVDGRGPLGGLISSAIDVDRLDYLARDAHHTGVPYGTIDHGRLIDAFRVVDGTLALAGDDVLTAESVLIARTLMNATVYRHHVSRIAGAMLDRASERLLRDGVVAPDRFARLTDAELLAELTDYEDTRDFGERIRGRNLYKRAVWSERTAVPERFVDLSYDRTRELEAEIAELAGVEPGAVIVDSPGLPTSPEAQARIESDGELSRLHTESALVDGLHACARELWRFGVYTRPEATDTVADAAESVFELPAERS